MSLSSELIPCSVNTNQINANADATPALLKARYNANERPAKIFGLVGIAVGVLGVGLLIGGMAALARTNSPKVLFIALGSIPAFAIASGLMSHQSSLKNARQPKINLLRYLNSNSIETTNEPQDLVNFLENVRVLQVRPEQLSQREQTRLNLARTRLHDYVNAQLRASSNDSFLATHDVVLNKIVGIANYIGISLQAEEAKDFRRFYNIRNPKKPIPEPAQA